MSEPIVNEAHSQQILQEEENLPIGYLLKVAAVTLIVFGISIAITGWLFNVWTGGLDAVIQPQPVEGREAGIVDMDLFDDVGGGNAEAYRSSTRARLDGYGWVDRDAGTVHIPIDQAMRQVEQEYRRR